MIIVNRNKLTLKIIAIIMSVSLFEPSYISQGIYPYLDLLYNLLKIICAAIGILNLLIKRTMQKEQILIFTFEMSLLFVTLHYGNGIYSYVVQNSYILVLTLLLSDLIKKDAPMTINTVGHILGIYVIINLASVLLFPDGMYVTPVGFKGWFLGQKNQAVPYALLAMMCMLYDSEMRNRSSVFTLLIIICSEAYMIIIGTSTGLIVSFLGLFFILLSHLFNGINKVFTCKNMVVICFTLFFLLVVFNVQNAGFLSTFFRMLGKNVTFSGRTGLWEKALLLIKTSPLFGFGVRGSDYYKEISGIWWAVHLHSYYLQTLFDGGIITFMLLFLLLYNGAYQYDKNSLNINSSIIKYFLLAFLIAIQFEVYSQMSLLFIIIIIMYHIGEIESQYERNTSPAIKLIVRQKLLNRKLRVI